ncbi:MAG: nodulation protein NfeD [Bacteroidales bacterium]|nr:nodulation protein NfeD [Bacteroidales bacterium]
MKSFATLFISIFIILSCPIGSRAQEKAVRSFYIIGLHKEIDKSSARMFTDALKQAQTEGADYCILDLNTYGGALDAADSIRTAIMHSPIPVVAFINNQAASAGALISIACDSIYMRNGSSIGAATVVDQSGEVLPDKYQSFMRAMMRATAESHGIRHIISGNDTLEIWRRDPLIAEKMVSADSVLSFTPSEAIANGYCEGKAENTAEVIAHINNYKQIDYTITEHKSSLLDKIIYFFLSPIIQGLLLMLIIGGIYFEFQSPGIGFPLVAAIVGVVLYFVPLYLEGFVQNWEIIFFILGLVLLAVEVFVLPGFGIAGICGIVLVVITLAFAMIDNDIVFNAGDINLIPLVKPFAIVLVSTTAMLFLSIYLAGKLLPSRAFSHIALKTSLSSGREGFVGVEKESLAELVGKDAVVATDLKPQGSVEIEGKTWQAQLNYGYAHKGEIVEIFRHEGGRLYCKKKI